MANNITSKIFKWNNLLLLMAFITPLSFAVDFTERLSLSIPLEPLLASLCFIFILKICYDKNYDRTILQHPLTIITILYLLWAVITSATSAMPLVSFKHTIAQIWFIIPAFFICGVAFKYFSFIKIFIWAYLLPLCLIVLYADIKLAFFEGISFFNAHINAAAPFFNEHTEYGAIIMLFLPMSCYLYFCKKSSKIEKYIAFGCCMILLTGLILSFSRAAWLSLFIGLFIFLLITLPKKYRRIFYCISITGVLFISTYIYLSPNNQQPSDNLIKHLLSSSNFTSNASNMERINRWNAGFKMVEENPVYGKGPGTYQFLYGPYQKFKQLNEGSTHQGNLGTIHSEYLTALVDSGLVGLGIFMALVIFIFITGSKNIRKSTDNDYKNLSIALVVTFTMYFSHVVFNNFLYMEKIAIPFFAFIAILATVNNNRITE